MGSSDGRAAVNAVSGSGGVYSGVLTMAIVDLTTDWGGWEGGGGGQQ